MRLTTTLAPVLVLVALVPLFPGCSTAPSTESDAGCSTDRYCALGEECAGGGCAEIPPTRYDHIQIASPLVRDHMDGTEPAWRAATADVLIGRTLVTADEMRAANPNARLFEYFNIRHHRYEVQAQEWAAANGYDPEDFYLHYREDIIFPGYETVVMVEGFDPGVVPGWNPDRQPDDPPASATVRSQSRAFGHAFAPYVPWYLANITHPGYREFAIDYMARLLDGSLYGINNATGPVEGIMIDEAVYYPMFNIGQLHKTTEFYGLPLEDNHPYAVAFGTFYVPLKRELNRRVGIDVDVMLNFGHTYWFNSPDPLSKVIQWTTDWGWGEVWMTFYNLAHPTSGSTRTITYDVDYEDGIVAIVRQTLAGGRRVLGVRDLSAVPDGTDRGRLYTLALYYLAHNANTFYTYESVDGHGIELPVAQWQSNPAVSYDIGQPAAVPPGFVDFEGRFPSIQHYEFASGPDPHDPTLTYHVLARKFTNGMVLVKMLPRGSVIDVRSETTHALDGQYAVLQADGTPGPLVTEVTLRNNEGVVLVTP